RTTERPIHVILLGDFPRDDVASRPLLIVAGFLLRHTVLRHDVLRRQVRLNGAFYLLFGKRGKPVVSGIAITLARGFRFLRIEPIDDSVLNFIGVHQNVALVETDDLAEVVDASLVAIGNARLDRMLQDVAEELAIKDLPERRRPN